MRYFSALALAILILLAAWVLPHPLFGIEGYASSSQGFDLDEAWGSAGSAVRSGVAGSLFMSEGDPAVSNDARNLPADFVAD